MKLLQVHSVALLAEFSPDQSGSPMGLNRLKGPIGVAITISQTFNEPPPGFTLSTIATLEPGTFVLFGAAMVALIFIRKG
jgi:hypothetical protein